MVLQVFGVILHGLTCCWCCCCPGLVQGAEYPCAPVSSVVVVTAFWSSPWRARLTFGQASRSLLNCIARLAVQSSSASSRSPGWSMAAVSLRSRSHEVQRRARRSKTLLTCSAVSKAFAQCVLGTAHRAANQGACLSTASHSHQS